VSLASEPLVGTVQAESPAERGGLQAGDRILRFDGVAISTWDDLVAVIEGRPEQEVAVEVRRGGQPVTLQVTPGRRGDVGFLGITAEATTVKVGGWQAIGVGFTAAAELTARQAAGFWLLLTGRMKDGRLTGLPGILKLVSAEAERGLRFLLESLAHLSITLFILNLLPVPALDGGRLIFLGVEVARGKPVDARVEGIVHAIGFILVIGLVAFVSIRDLLT